MSRATFALAAAFLASFAVAQDPSRTPIEVRLIEILHENKVITDAQRDELRVMADAMRREEESEAKIDTELSARIAELAERTTNITDRLGKADATIDHKPGRGFRFLSLDRKFELQVGGRIQVRFTQDFWEKNKVTDGEDEPHFDVPRARIRFDGHAFEEWIKYRILFDVAGDQAATEVGFLNIFDDFDSSNRLTELKDAYVEFAKWSAFKVRAGQFKTPYSRHSLTGVGDLQFVDRSITDRIFGAGRSPGVMIHGGAFGEDDDILEYGAGVFDGDGENRSNDDKGLLWAGRATISPFGSIPLRDGDLGRSGKFKVALGLNAWIHQDDNHAGEGDDWSAGADLAARYEGWFVLAELHYAEANGFPLDDPRAVGWLAQLGFTMIEDTLDIAVRGAEIDWDDNEDRDSGRREYLLVLGWFLHGHDLKIQTDFGWVEDHQGDQDDNKDGWRLRTQIQITF